MSKCNLSGLTAMVTGGAGGIGLEFAKVLYSFGASLILLDINEQRLKQAKESISQGSPSSNIHLLPIDLTSENIVEEIENFCSGSSLSPEILINNAGIFSFCPIDETDE